MSIEVDLLTNMIAADLELAYEHLGNGEIDLFRHELNNALEKAGQIEALRQQSSPKPVSDNQPLLIESSTDEQSTPATGNNPEDRRREA